MLKSSHASVRLLAVSMMICGVGALGLPDAAADPAGDSASVSTSADGSAAPAAGAVTAGIQSSTVSSADAEPAAVEACGKFADALDHASDGYGSYADSLEDNDGTAQMSNGLGRSSLRESASVAMDAANTPGLSPDIANPMRDWSFGAAKLMFKVGLSMSGDTLDQTATSVNTSAEAVQKACAAAGTHA